MAWDMNKKDRNSDRTGEMGQDGGIIIIIIIIIITICCDGGQHGRL